MKLERINAETTIQNVFKPDQLYYILSLEENKTKPINVLWSGGCDSTLILWEILNVLKRLNDERTVNTYAISHDQVGYEKMNREKQKRNQFIVWSEMKGFVNKIIHKDIRVDSNTIFSQNCGQPALWISQVIPFIVDKSMLFAGYHKGDDFLTYYIFRDWLNTFIGLSGLYGKVIDFHTPLAFDTKYDIIKKLKLEEGLYENTWWCETPLTNGTPCKHHCDPCKLHYLTLLKIETELKEISCSCKIEETHVGININPPYDGATECLF